MDFDSRLGRKALRKLKREHVVWLTSVDDQSRPQPRPVWFHWNAEEVLIFSQPNAGKVRQIAARPQVALHFNSDESGNEVVVFLGEARVLREPLAPERMKAYLRKYRSGIVDLEMTPASFQAEYSVPILVRPTTLRGF
jgi:PPOX class probable F420-dependent enzyme